MNSNSEKNTRQARLALLLVFVIGAISVGCGSDKAGTPPVPVKDIPFRDDGKLIFQRDIGDTTEVLAEITIEIADTDTLRNRGLMDRQHIPSDRGMLFIFPESSIQTFWMANTQSSLDLLFVSEDSVISDIAKYARPMSPDIVAGQDPAMYVVEVAAGYTDNRGIVVGDRISWTRSN